jgi:hypothetical protein
LVKRGIGRTIGPVWLKLAAEPVGPLPQIGFTLPTDCPLLGRRQAERLRLLKPSYLRCDVNLAGDIGPTLQRAIHTAAILNTPLDLALFVGAHPERELESLAAFIKRTRPPIARWTIFSMLGWSTTRDLIATAIRHLRPLDPTIPIGGGTQANFRELNGQRPPTDILDFITWSQTPQIHAFDNASLVETLAAHTATVESARQFAGSRPLVVGPNTFRMQNNPYATGPWPPPTLTGQLPHDIDLRQMSLFGAGWTLGSIKYLAESGVQAATYYDLVGWKGLMERETGSPLPGQFPSLPGSVFPVYHVFADLAEMPDAQVVPLKSTDPLWIDGLALTNGPYTRLLVANLTGVKRQFWMQTDARRARIRTLTKGSLPHGMASPEQYRSKRNHVKHIWNGCFYFELQPYAYARIDLT